MTERPKKMPYPKFPPKRDHHDHYDHHHHYMRPYPMPHPHFYCDMRVLKQMYCHMKACHRYEMEMFRRMMCECLKCCKPRRHKSCHPYRHYNLDDYESSSYRYYESPESPAHYHAQTQDEESSTVDQ